MIYVRPEITANCFDYTKIDCNQLSHLLIIFGNRYDKNYYILLIYNGGISRPTRNS